MPSNLAPHSLTGRKNGDFEIHQKPLTLPRLSLNSFLCLTLSGPGAQMLEKMISQGGCCCSFLIETSQKIFIYLESAEIDMEGQFWVEKNDSKHKK